MKQNNPNNETSRHSLLLQDKLLTTEMNAEIRTIFKSLAARQNRQFMPPCIYEQFFAGVVTYQGLKNFAYGSTDFSRETATAVYHAAIEAYAVWGSKDPSEVEELINQVSRIPCVNSRKKRMMGVLRSISSSEIQ